METVLSGWQKKFPEMGIYVMLPEAEKENVSVIQDVCRSLKIPVVGGIFPQLINSGIFTSEGAWFLFFEKMPFYSIKENFPVDSFDLDGITEDITDEITREIEDIPDITLLMLFDGMIPNISTFLDMLYMKLANRVNYVGANAGSETFQPMPCIFDGERTVHNGVLFLLINHHQGAILEHGYKTPDDPVYATAASGNCISQIDWRPAFEVYQELVKNKYGIEINKENFYEYSVHFPFGILRANHHVLVRIPVLLNEEGGLVCVGEVAPNSMLTLLEAPAVNSEETLTMLINGLNSLNGKSSDKNLLVFYCAGRRMHMGIDASSRELKRFSEMSGAENTSGALSLGEIGGSTVHGYPLFHNATIVATGWKSG